MNREKRTTKMSFPFGLYLKQLFSADTYVKYINPFSFWHRYKIDRLEACRELDTVKYLENCRQLDCQVIKHANTGLDKDYTDVSVNSLSKQTELNTIYISQPWIELKYRGVSYYTRDTSNINIHVVEIDPSTVKSNSFGYVVRSNNSSTPRKFGSN